MNDRTGRRTVRRRTSVGAAVLVAVALVLAGTTGCARQVRSLPVGSGASTGPNGVVASASPAPASKQSSPSTRPTPSAPANRSHIVTLHPSGSGDVAFSSPSGRIWCTISSGHSRGAICTIPAGDVRSEIPSTAKACAGNSKVAVIGVGVRDGKAHWACGTDLAADPRTGNDNPAVRWNSTANYPVVASSLTPGASVVTLPYYHSIVIGPVGCTSYPSYVACGDSTTSVSVFVNSRAISVDGQVAVLPDG